MKLAAIRSTTSAITPPAEYHSVSLLRFMFSPCALVANDHAGGEQRKTDHGHEKDDIARIEHTALESFEMRHDRERGDHLDHERIRKAREQVRHGRVAGQDQEKADHD